MNEVKQCTKCKEAKPVAEFYAQKGMKDGRFKHCKTCHNAETLKNQKARKGSFSQKSIHAKNSANRSAKKYGVESTLTLAEVREVLSADNCDYCDKHLEQNEKSLEHVIPFECGGTNTFGNVTLACLDCNTKKSARPAFEFILLNGDATAARRLLYTLAERNEVEPQDYLYTLAQAGLEWRTARLRRRFGVEAQ